MEDERIQSPACGRILEIASTEWDPGVKGPLTRISIFLSLWDDHTTRAPIGGRIDETRYSPGKFGIALFKKNLTKNENNLIGIEGKTARLAVRQISGRIARRILCACRVNDSVEQGQKLGAIQFGSCVQLYLPTDARLCVAVGQKVWGGKTTMAFFKR